MTEFQNSMLFPTHQQFVVLFIRPEFVQNKFNEVNSKSLMQILTFGKHYCVTLLTSLAQPHQHPAVLNFEILHKNLTLEHDQRRCYEQFPLLVVGSSVSHQVLQLERFVSQ